MCWMMYIHTSSVCSTTFNRSLLASVVVAARRRWHAVCVCVCVCVCVMLLCRLRVYRWQCYTKTFKTFCLTSTATTDYNSVVLLMMMMMMTKMRALLSERRTSAAAVAARMVSVYIYIHRRSFTFGFRGLRQWGLKDRERGGVLWKGQPVPSPS